MRRLALDENRRKRECTWSTLSIATGIPIRTLHDIDRYGRKQDIDEIEIRRKTKLLLIAKYWEIEYEDLFVEEDNPKWDSKKEKEDLDEFINDLERILKKRRKQGKDSGIGDDVLEELKKMRFIFKGDFDELYYEYLDAQAEELNGLSKSIIGDFVSRIKDQESQKQERVINNIVRKLCDTAFMVEENIIGFFALHMLENDFVDTSGSLLEEFIRRQIPNHEELD